MTTEQIKNLFAKSKGYENWKSLLQNFTILQARFLDEMLTFAIKQIQTSATAKNIIPFTKRECDAMDFANDMKRNAYQKLMETNNEYWKGEIVAVDGILDILTKNN